MGSVSVNYIFRTHYEQHVYSMELKKFDIHIKYFEKVEFSIRAGGVID